MLDNFKNAIDLPNYQRLAQSLSNDPRGFLGVAGMVANNTLFSKNTEQPNPRPKILSSKARISLLITGKNGLREEIDIGELDEFNARKSLTVVKRFKPFGSKFEEVITEDTSWDLNFGGTKVDWKAAYLFHANEIALSGLDASNRPSGNNSLGAIYVRPTFDIVQSITYYDGKLEEYNYKDVVLLDYDLSIVGDNVTIPERFSAVAKMRFLNSGFFDHETTKINSSIAEMLSVLNEEKSRRF